MAFQRKQQALLEAVDMGDRLAHRRRRELVTATLFAWHLRSGRQKAVAARRAALQQLSKSQALCQWRAFAAHKVAFYLPSPSFNGTL